MSDVYTEYWAESLSIAAEECGLTLTPEQLKYLAEAMEGSHENYGMAFYSPPASDRFAQIEREHKARLAALQAEFDAYRTNAETAVKTALRQRSDANISIGKNGEVIRYDGRVTVIQ